MNNSSLVSHSYGYIFSNATNNLDPLSNSHFNLIVIIITCILTFLICIAGTVGNGIVIWLLGFRMRRNPFTTYVLNLAVADIGVLLYNILGYIVSIILPFSRHLSFLGFYISAYIGTLLYFTDQLLLTVISVDRCVAVLFPLWHRCHRPPHLSGIVCFSTWVLSLLIVGLDFFGFFVNVFLLLQFIVNVGICTPIMAISTIILFVKSCMKSQQRKQRKLLLAISLALFFFLLFGFPVNYCYFVIYYYVFDGIDVRSLLSSTPGYSESNATMILKLLSRINLIIIPYMVALVCTVLNCSLNPLIYFLVGGKKKGRSRQSVKVALQRIFQDDEYHRGQEGPQSETQF